MICWGEREIWRELAWYEGYERFREVAVLLQRKYGRALRDLVPRDESELYLYGDELDAPSRVEKVRAELARGAFAGSGSRGGRGEAAKGER